MCNCRLKSLISLYFIYMCDTNFLTICLQIIAIFINLIIAFIAIFGERIKGLFYRPELNLSITSLFPDCNLTTFSTGTNTSPQRLVICRQGYLLPALLLYHAVPLEVQHDLPHLAFSLIILFNFYKDICSPVFNVVVCLFNKKHYRTAV